MNIFENMCVEISNLSTKVNAGTEFESAATLRENYFAQYKVANAASWKCVLELQKLQKKVVGLSKKEADLQRPLLRNKFFQLPIIWKVVIMCRRTPELRKVQEDLSELSRRKKDLLDQREKILDYADRISPLCLPHELKTQEI